MAETPAAQKWAVEVIEIDGAWRLAAATTGAAEGRIAFLCGHEHTTPEAAEKCETARKARARYEGQPA